MKRLWMLSICMLILRSSCYAVNNAELLVVSNGTFKGSNLETYLINRKASYVVVDKTMNLASVMHHHFKGIILTGGPLLYSSGTVNIEDVNINFAALLNIDCPVLGICFGHQTITELFGGKMGRMQEASIGMQKVTLLKKVAIFEGLPDEVEFKQYHYDCSMEIPYNFDLIATSDICYSEGIKHKTKPIFGIQFHPEGSGPLGYKVMDNFLRLCACTFSAEDDSFATQETVCEVK